MGMEVLQAGFYFYNSSCLDFFYHLVGKHDVVGMTQGFLQVERAYAGFHLRQSNFQFMLMSGSRKYEPL